MTISSFYNGLSLSIRLDKCTDSFIFMTNGSTEREKKHLVASRVTLMDFHLKDTEHVYAAMSANFKGINKH